MAGVENVGCGGKLLKRIKGMYVDGLACVRINGIVSERFRIDNGVRQGCIISSWLFNVCMDAVMKEVKMGKGRRGENGHCLASCMQMTWFCVVSRRRT